MRALRIAVAAEYKKLAADIERGEKDDLVGSWPAGTRFVVESDRFENGQPVRLGTVQVKEGTPSGVAWDIAHEPSVIEWMLTEWGADCVEQKLRTQYRTSATEMAKKAWANSGIVLPGIVRRITPGSEPTVAWTSNKNVDVRAELAAMVTRRVIDLPEYLALEGTTE